jgi:hypothetical protein
MSRKFCHKMWAVALMTPMKVSGKIHTIEKSPLFSVCSDARKSNSTGIQASLFITHILRCVRKS